MAPETEVDYLQDPAKAAAARRRAAEERVVALLGPDPADPATYWQALAAADWSGWAPPAPDVLPDWLQV